MSQYRVFRIHDVSLFTIVETAHYTVKRRLYEGIWIKYDEDTETIHIYSPCSLRYLVESESKLLNKSEGRHLT